MARRLVTDVCDDISRYSNIMEWRAECFVKKNSSRKREDIQYRGGCEQLSTPF
jgi:hypothetical protein